jgi:hypothetical protein
MPPGARIGIEGKPEHDVWLAPGSYTPREVVAFVNADSRRMRASVIDGKIHIEEVA